MSIFGKVRKILTINCRETTEIMSAAMDEPVPWSDRAAAWLHSTVCGGCRQFRRQLQFIHEAAQHRQTRREPAGDSEPVGLTDDARARMEESIRKSLDDE